MADQRATRSGENPRLSLNVPGDLYEELGKLADKQDVSMGHLVRLAIREFLDSKKKK